MTEVATFQRLPDVVKLLAHDLRWNLLRQLAHSDLRVAELAARVARPLNLVSYHLAQLRRGALVAERRSSGDARDVYYSLDLERLQSLYEDAAGALHPALAPLPAYACGAVESAPGPLRLAYDRGSIGVAPRLSPLSPLKVLFLCTHNSARSQMAEALLRQMGSAQVEVQSAGVEVSGVHPLAVETMAQIGIDIGGQRSKHVDEFSGQTFDYIITVCDRMREVCPVFPGDPAQIHWSIGDPAAIEGDVEVQRQAFTSVARQLTTRLRYFLAVIEHSLIEHA
ncbi:MAG: hypothetical protein R6W76_07960 [Caldilinea sp.]